MLITSLMVRYSDWRAREVLLQLVDYAASVGTAEKKSCSCLV